VTTADGEVALFLRGANGGPPPSSGANGVPELDSGANGVPVSDVFTE
jgi:hypothetical protein